MSYTSPVAFYFIFHFLRLGGWLFYALQCVKISSYDHNCVNKSNFATVYPTGNIIIIHYNRYNIIKHLYFQTALPISAAVRLFGAPDTGYLKKIFAKEFDKNKRFDVSETSMGGPFTGHCPCGLCGTGAHLSTLFGSFHEKFKNIV